MLVNVLDNLFPHHARGGILFGPITLQINSRTKLFENLPIRSVCTLIMALQ